MSKRKLASMQSTLASDSDSDEDISRTEEAVNRALRTDAEGRTHISTSVLNVPASPKKKPAQRNLLQDVFSPPPTTWDASAPDYEPLPFTQEESFPFDEGHPVDAPPRKPRDSDNPLRQWLNGYRVTFLDELLRLEGRGDYRFQTMCAGCAVDSVYASYRCKDCFSDALFCKDCVVKEHRDNPLHRIEMWNNRRFEQVTLKSLGLRMQLGHGRNGTCPGTLAKRARQAKVPEQKGRDDEGGMGAEDASVADGAPQKHDDFCIVDSNGIHEVGLDFCSCALAEEHTIQLLRARLYPATTTKPASAATFGVLRQFHMLSLESKCSAHHFYNGLARMTNNSGVFQPRNRYHEFLRMTREWRHLQLLKRAGRGHAADGIDGTEEGECALLCPACPQPGKNLPRDRSWRSVPKNKRYLYALFLAIDANFRMKRKIVSSEEDDPALGDGMAFFGKLDQYMSHVEKHWDIEQEKSTCVAHDAVDEPDREAYGTASSGIGTVDCARHNMKRPRGIGDLQKGERYINMDYMLWNSMNGYDDLVELFVSYDIVCQWHKNIWTRLLKYKPQLQERGQRTMNGVTRGYSWLIPKFHLPAHIEACNLLYSFNLTPYVGQTDGEAPERGWANTNPLANSTKEMGPGSRRDALDDHFNDWNHKKIIGLGAFLLDRVQKGVENMANCRVELWEAEQGLPVDVVTKWRKEMEDWEEDAGKPNPFKVVDKAESLYAIRGRLAADAEKDQAGDEADDVRGDLHATEMITMGLKLEEEQRTLESDTKAIKMHATDRQKTGLRERSNKLARKITEWIKIQASFSPTVVTLRAADERARAAAARLQPTPGIPVFATKLWLPSRLASAPGGDCKDSHARYEFELRVGQANEALEEIRRLLLVRAHKFYHKNQFARGVAANTRANTSLKKLEEQLRRVCALYRAARQALVSLGPKLGRTEWKQTLRVLAADDVRGRPRGTFSDPQHKSRLKRRRTQTPVEAAEELRKKKEEERAASWIWLALLSEGEDSEAGMTAALKVEWAKTRARAWRWTEEVNLVEEEMRRVLGFLTWRAEWWEALIDERRDLSDALREAIVAYGTRQAELQRSLRDRFEENWKDVPRYIAMGRAQLDEIREDGEEDEQASTQGDYADEELDPDAPVPEVPRDTLTVASLVEESLA
ncbi:hypothetical protein C8R43DRAFT_1138715 [Mycena crocata]|nr:hypothetical protein C8R43DRAFT_1138715 [Mycena crocata]